MISSVHKVPNQRGDSGLLNARIERDNLNNTHIDDAKPLPSRVL